ncbi:uncharacterized protein KY384_005261 [Bacidia gigantensis]|uniref:uncharacterized protein n=1 Tax=Bacidia gigantensis TaxID=2732470 RepID=UPI001D059C0B|nr:uncharacterized protein KY384_005261 [Bacidia gigantensis]KAG8529780.1 hypothetical protein KY384_005261 [Bacidia gigantensis]
MEERTAFFYGTLMVPQVLHRVLYGSTQPHQSQIQALKIQPAMLFKYVRHRVVDADYPAIIASSEVSTSVRGTYVQGLTAADIWRLDIFEGDEYERVKVCPRILDANGEQGDTVSAETYVWIDSREDLEQEEWDFEEFKREKLHRWVGVGEWYEEVDEAVEKLEDQRNPTGGRFVDGKMTAEYGGGGEMPGS